jgi:hypothetical protein
MVALTCVPADNKWRENVCTFLFCCRCVVRGIQRDTALTPLLFSVPMIELVRFQLTMEIEVRIWCGEPIPTNGRVPGGAKKPQLCRARASTNVVHDACWQRLWSKDNSEIVITCHINHTIDSGQAFLLTSGWQHEKTFSFRDKSTQSRRWKF